MLWRLGLLLYVVYDIPIYIVEFLILLNFTVIFHSVNATTKDTWSSESISSAPKI